MTGCVSGWRTHACVYAWENMMTQSRMWECAFMCPCVCAPGFLVHTCVSLCMCLLCRHMGGWCICKVHAHWNASARHMSVCWCAMHGHGHGVHAPMHVHIVHVAMHAHSWLPACMSVAC